MPVYEIFIKNLIKNILMNIEQSICGSVISKKLKPTRLSYNIRMNENSGKACLRILYKNKSLILKFRLNALFSPVLSLQSVLLLLTNKVDALFAFASQSYN